jgi:glycosyl transferase family 1
MNLVLLGHYRPGYRLSYYFDWRDAFLALQCHSVRLINTAQPGRRPVALFERLPMSWSFPEADVRALYEGRIPCDVLVVPPSFYYFNLGRRRRFIEGTAAKGVRRFTTVFFIENEYRLIPDKVAYAMALGASVLVSQLPLDTARSLYGARFPGRVVSAPAGLNPDVFRPGPPAALRRVDVGTRTHVYPASLGDTDRNALVERFAGGGGAIDGLTTDISVAENDRFSREDWARFLQECRATVATEAGASTVSWGSGHPQVSGKTVSSRHFEALGTKTAQIMFPGRFSDMLRPGEHYIALERDFRNLEEVCQAVRDVSFITRLTDGAHEYALSAHTYAHRVRAVLAAV